MKTKKGSFTFVRCRRLLEIPLDKVVEVIEAPTHGIVISLFFDSFLPLLLFRRLSAFRCLHFDFQAVPAASRHVQFKVSHATHCALTFDDCARDCVACAAVRHGVEQYRLLSVRQSEPAHTLRLQIALGVVHFFGNFGNGIQWVGLRSV